MGNQSYPNKLSQNIFENLKERTGVPVEVHIDGITADPPSWDPNQEAALYNLINSTSVLINTIHGPQFWNFEAFTRRNKDHHDARELFVRSPGMGI
jgi:hypothetical protein